MSSKFGMSFGSDSDSSDAEFAPEDEVIDSDGMFTDEVGRNFIFPTIAAVPTTVYAVAQSFARIF